MSSVPPEKRCTTFFRLATSDTASATPEDHGPTTNFAPSASTASSVRRVEVPACVPPSRVMYLIGRPRTFMSRSSSAIFMPRSLSGPTSAKAPVWSHRPRITISFDCARTIAGNARPVAASAPILRMSLRSSLLIVDLPWSAVAGRLLVKDAIRHSSRPSPSGSRLTFEQRPLALDAPAVARERAVVAHDAVAGNGDRDRVGGAGVRHRAHGFRHADALRDLRVGRSRAGRDLAQRLPDALLKGGSAHVERQIETQGRRLDQAHPP